MKLLDTHPYKVYCNELTQDGFVTYLEGQFIDKQEAIRYKNKQNRILKDHGITKLNYVLEEQKSER